MGLLARKFQFLLVQKASKTAAMPRQYWALGGDCTTTGRGLLKFDALYMDLCLWPASEWGYLWLLRFFSMEWAGLRYNFAPQFSRRNQSFSC